MPNNAYSLWRVNGWQQGLCFVAKYGFGGQKSALKPPQAIYETVSANNENNKTWSMPFGLISMHLGILPKRDEV